MEREDESAAGSSGGSEPSATDDPTAAPGLGGVADHWDDIVGDMEATAGEYRERGWETLELHPGQVSTDVGEGAFDVLLPDDEYESLVAFVDAGDVDGYDVFRAEAAVVFFLLVLRDADRKRAVFLPGYYDPGEGAALYRRVENSLEVTAHRLRRDGAVTFSLDRPEEFFPETVRQAPPE